MKDYLSKNPFFGEHKRFHHFTWSWSLWLAISCQPDVDGGDVTWLPIRGKPTRCAEDTSVKCITSLKFPMLLYRLLIVLLLSLLKKMNVREGEQGDSHREQSCAIEVYRPLQTDLVPQRDTPRTMLWSHLTFNMAALTQTVKFLDIYELKEELGK